MTAKKSSKKSYEKRRRVLTKIKLIRLRRGFQQKEICEAVGISAGRLCEIENGITPPSPKSRTLLAAFFSVSEEKLFPPNKKV